MHDGEPHSDARVTELLGLPLLTAQPPNTSLLRICRLISRLHPTYNGCMSSGSATSQAKLDGSSEDEMVGRLVISANPRQLRNRVLLRTRPAIWVC